MNIGFRPQKLTNNLVLEQVSKNGKTLRRIIEVPGKKARTIELTYKQNEFLPTQWYVANYNVMKRGADGAVSKTFIADKTAKDKSKAVIQNIYPQSIQQITIDIANNKTSKTSTFITK